MGPSVRLKSFQNISISNHSIFELVIFSLALDDVFVRRDLYEGKYAPDLEKQRQFEEEMNGNRAWDDGVLVEDLKAVAHNKEEL